MKSREMTCSTLDMLKHIQNTEILSNFEVLLMYKGNNMLILNSFLLKPSQFLFTEKFEPIHIFVVVVKFYSYLNFKY